MTERVDLIDAEPVVLSRERAIDRPLELDTRHPLFGREGESGTRSKLNLMDTVISEAPKRVKAEEDKDEEEEPVEEESPRKRKQPSENDKEAKKRKKEKKKGRSKE